MSLPKWYSIRPKFAQLSLVLENCLFKVSSSVARFKACTLSISVEALIFVESLYTSITIGFPTALQETTALTMLWRFDVRIFSSIVLFNSESIVLRTILPTWTPTGPSIRTVLFLGIKEINFCFLSYIKFTWQPKFSLSKRIPSFWCRSWLNWIQILFLFTLTTLPISIPWWLQVLLFINSLPLALYIWPTVYSRLNVTRKFCSSKWLRSIFSNTFFTWETLSYT